MKLIIAATARKNDPDINDERSRHYWAGIRGKRVVVPGKTNPETGATWMAWGEAGRRYLDLPQQGNYNFSHRYGFGTVDAKAAVALAKTWTNLPAYADASYPGRSGEGGYPVRINDKGKTFTTGSGVESTDTWVTTATADDDVVNFIEHIQLDLLIDTGDFRDLRMVLTSPHGTESLLMKPFVECWVGYGVPDVDRDGYADDEELEPGNASPCVRVYGGSDQRGSFLLGSSRHLGESPCNGDDCDWTLKIADEEKGDDVHSIDGWTLKFYGHLSDRVDPDAEGDEDEDEGEDTDDEGTGGGGDVDGTCASNATTLCLQDSRFKVEASWKVNYEDFPRRTLVEARTQASGILAVGPNNEWGLLVKLLDGCDITGGLWAMLSETYTTPSPADWSDTWSNLNKKAIPLWTVRITDTVGDGAPYYMTNERENEDTTHQGRTIGRARINRYAFPQVCGEAAASLPVKVDVGRPGLSSVIEAASVASASSDACGDGPNRVCLYDRFDVLVDWEDVGQDRQQDQVDADRRDL